MTLLIINADDYGYSKAINLGIIESFRNGILSSTTMMANMPGFYHGVDLAKKNSDLGIGVHLTLTCGRPLSNKASTLIKSNGEFHDLSFYEKNFTIDEDELYKEWSLQIKKIKESGIEPTHLDTHHHVNILHPINKIFIQLAREYNLPVRNNFNVPNDLKTVDKFNIEFENLVHTKEIWKPLILNNLIKDCVQFNTVEIMCHPGYLDYEVFENSSLLDGRVYIIEELKKQEYKDLLNKHSINLGTYKDIVNKVID